MLFVAGTLLYVLYILTFKLTITMEPLIVAILVVQTIAVFILGVGLCMAFRLYTVIVRATETIMYKATQLENTAKTWTSNPLGELFSNIR